MTLRNIAFVFLSSFALSLKNYLFGLNEESSYFTPPCRQSDYFSFAYILAKYVIIAHMHLEKSALFLDYYDGRQYVL